MPPLRFARVESSLGPMLVAQTDRGVAAVGPATSLDIFLEPLRRRFPSLEPVPDELDLAWLTDALDGGGGAMPDLDLRGLGAFERRVYEIVHAIPRGETMTYGDVAAAAGSPRAARAVGNAMARCPLFPAVPCHRVVRASDGWSGWGGDPDLKRRLLTSERRAARRPAAAAEGVIGPGLG